MSGRRSEGGLDGCLLSARGGYFRHSSPIRISQHAQWRCCTPWHDMVADGARWSRRSRASIFPLGGRRSYYGEAGQHPIHPCSVHYDGESEGSERLGGQPPHEAGTLGPRMQMRKDPCLDHDRMPGRKWKQKWKRRQKQKQKRDGESRAVFAQRMNEERRAGARGSSSELWWGRA